MSLVNMLKVLYYRNKLFFVLAIVALVLLVGCNSQAGAPPPGGPSGPIGGGC